MAKKVKKVQGLKRRWLTGSMGPVLVILLLVGVLISVGFASSYYNSARSALRAKAAAGADYFNTYVMTSYREYYRSATVYAAAFDDGDRIELQFLNSSGRVEVTTRGVTVGTYPGTPEIYSAIESGEVKDYVGRDVVTGERIMAASSLLKFNGQVVGVMRYVTAIGNIDRQVLLTVLLVAGVMVAVVGLIVLSSMIFINNVVAPVSAVSEAAKRISGGSYGVQIPNKYSDEMGELVDNINDMSRKIGESERMKSEFISSVSHELRTPLTAINGWGETLLEDESNDVQQLKRGVQIMVKESRRLTNMVEELLQFSRLEDGRFTLQVEDTDLQAELEDAVYSYRELFRQDGIALEYSSDRAEYSEVISGDPERLKQVFCNLLDNAAKHGGSGKRITVHLTQRDGEYVITIRDFGPGIPEAELPYVKQKFYKGSSKARGSGIGLAVCDEIVQRHGGRLDIANAEGGADYLVEEQIVADPENIAVNIPESGTLAPTGEYYVTSFLMTEKETDLDGDGVMEKALAAIDSNQFNSKISYTNTKQPESPATVHLEVAGNEVMRAGWQQVDNADGYRVTIYQQQNGGWVDTGFGYDLDNKTTSIDMALTVGGEETAESKNLSANETYKVGVSAYRTMEGGKYYSAEAESRGEYLPEYTPLNLALSVNGTACAPDENGVYHAYVGIGITIEAKEQEGFLVKAVNEGGPAGEAGVQVDDLVIEVEGQDVREMTATDVRNLVRGEEGTCVSLTVLRQGERVTLSVERRQVQTVVASGRMLTDKIGLVTIENFDSRCAEETIAAIDDLLGQGAEKLIFDVRNNPGGYAKELVKVLDYLLPEGELFRTVDYAGKENVDHSDADCLDTSRVARMLRYASSSYPTNTSRRGCTAGWVRYARLYAR